MSRSDLSQPLLESPTIHRGTNATDEGDASLATANTQPIMSQQSSISSKNVQSQAISTVSSSSSSTKSAKPTKDHLDAVCDRILNVIPPAPYHLSVNAGEPTYNHYSREGASAWRRGTSFYPHEERLQYMTYVNRDPSESCFIVRSEVDEERDRQLEKDRSERKRQHKKQESGSGVFSAESTRPGTPVNGGSGAGEGAKKNKISLSAFVKSKKLGNKEEGAGIELAKMGKEKDQSKKSQDNGVKVVERQLEGAVDARQERPNVGIKRQRDVEMEKAEKSSSVKKPRLSPPLSPPPSVKPEQPSSRPSLQPSPINRSNAAPHGLPVLLSPTNPFESAPPLASKQPAKSPKETANRWSLPPMLSPTMPGKIEEALAREKELGRPMSAASSPASKATPTPRSSAQSPAGQVEKREPSPLAKVKDSSKKLNHMVDSDGDDDKEADQRPPRTEPPKKLIVKLPYSKKIAIRIHRLLKQPPHPDRKKVPLDEHWLLAKYGSGSIKGVTSSTQSRPRSTSDLTSSPLQRPKENSSQEEKKKKSNLHPDAARREKSISEKRPQSDDAESNSTISKKPKVPASLDLEKEKNPRTPIASAVPSPALQKSSSSVKDSIHVTPRQGVSHKALAMARSNSTDSLVATPNGKNTSTPVAVKSASKGPTSAPAPSGPRAAELKALADHSGKYNALGRKLKHENQDINNRPGAKTEPERKRMALLGLECIMSYMLAYSLGDSRRKIEGRSAEIETSWRTLLPLFKHMGRFVAGYKPLEGVWNYLGVAINSRISTVAGDRVIRLQSQPVAADSPQSTIAGASDPAAENMRTHFEALAALTECTRAAASALPTEGVMTDFPATWKHRSTGSRGASSETLLDEKGEVSLVGGYWVPVGIDSAPVQAVRFAVKIVGEWIRIEELGYEPRIRI